jgi:hypothetical protein
LRALARPKRASHDLPREPCTPCPAEASTPRQDARPAPGTHHAPTPALLIRACCVRRLPALDLAADGGTALPGTTLAGTFLVCATLTGARARRHLARRHLALGRLARSPAPRSSPRHLARWCLARRCLAPSHPGRPSRQPPRMGRHHVCRMAVRARRPSVARTILGARTARQDPGSCAEDPAAMLCAIPAAYLLFLSLFRVPMSGIVGIARAIPTIPSMSVSRNSRNSESHYSWSYFSD